MEPRVIGRYALFGEIAAGGMATVHFGRLIGAEGFSRVVAIKRLHPQFSRDPDFVAMFLDEARLVARIRSPNVVPILDVVSTDGELFLVMEYVHGEPLGTLIRISLRPGGAPLTPRIASSIMIGMLNGLQAAHDARNESGAPLGIVHRDVSPQNVLVGVDGVPRVVDFGIAKASDRAQTTREGQVKGKMAYMAPEQVLGNPVTPATDIYAAGVVLWELLTRRRLHEGSNAVNTMRRILDEAIPPPSTLVKNLQPQLDAIVLRATQRDPRDRYLSARDMAAELEACTPPVTQTQLGEWVVRAAHSTLEPRQRSVDEVESSHLQLPPEVMAMRSAMASVHSVRAEPTSQASSVSLALPTASPPLPRSRTWLWALAAGVLGACISAVAVVALLVPKAGQNPASNMPSEPAAPTQAAPPATTVPAAESASQASASASAAPSAEPPAVSAEPSAKPAAPSWKPAGAAKRSGGAGANPDYVFESRK